MSPTWREQLREELGRRGLPQAYAERLVRELADHFDDIVSKEGLFAADRVGQPADLAAAAVAEYHRRAFSQTHPVLFFAVLPLLLLPVLWVVFGSIVSLAAYGVLSVAGLADDPHSALHLCIVNYLTTWLILVPPCILAVFFSRVARAKGIMLTWPLLTTGALAVVAGLMFSTVMSWGPNLEPRLAVCIGFGAPIQQGLQSVLVVIFGGWCCWSNRARPAEAELAL